MGVAVSWVSCVARVAVGDAVAVGVVWVGSDASYMIPSLVAIEARGASV